MAFENHALYRQPDSYDPEDKDNPRHWNASQIVLVVFATVIMAAGEVAALVGLYFELKHPIINMLVWYGLGAGIVGVVGLSCHISRNSTSSIVLRVAAAA
jgi:hypothetical protein